LALVSVALADPIAIPKRKPGPTFYNGSGDDVHVDELSEIECSKEIKELETRECHLINKVHCVDPVENQMIIYERKCIDVVSTHCQHIEGSDAIEDQFAGDVLPPEEEEFFLRKRVSSTVVRRQARQFHHPLVQPMMAYPYASPAMPMTYAHAAGAPVANYAAQVAKKQVINHGNVLGKLVASRSHPEPDCEDITTQHCVADPVIHNYVPETKICYATEGAECEEKIIEIPYVTCGGPADDDDNE